MDDDIVEDRYQNIQEEMWKKFWNNMILDIHMARVDELRMNSKSYKQQASVTMWR